MADYRGGAYGLSGAAAEAVNNINKGETPFQKNRELRQRAIGAGVNAALVGVAGAVKGQVSRDEENDKNRGVMQKAIANAKRSAGTRSDGTRGGESNTGGGPDPSTTNLGGSYPLNNADMDNAVRKGAGVALDRQATNDQAEYAPAGRHNYMTGPGMEEMVKQANVLGQDINTAKAAQVQGGMQNSLSPYTPEEEARMKFGPGY